MRIDGLRPAAPPKVLNPTRGSHIKAPGTPANNLPQTLTEALQAVNRLQLQASQSGKDLALGKSPPIHRVIIESEEASLALQLTLQMRNKAIEAYQEIMRMQI